MSVKVGIIQMNSTVGDLLGNSCKITDFSHRLAKQGADVILTPEFALVGYPPEDLLLRPTFHTKTYIALQLLAKKLAILRNVHIIVGHPWFHHGICFNSASILLNGDIISTYKKLELPNNGVFDEKRYFTSSKQAVIFNVKGICFGINICEDAWFTRAPKLAKQAGAQILLILNASPYHINKQLLRYNTMRTNVTTQGMSLIFANLVGGQDELVFDGNSFVLDTNGKLITTLAHAKEDYQLIEFNEKQVYCCTQSTQTLSIEAQIYQVLVLGVRDYVKKNNFSNVLLGLSGGIDSALTLSIAVDALGADKVNAIMMPSPYTTEISIINSRDMIKRINGVHYDEIPIDSCFACCLYSLAKKFNHSTEDVTEENIQTRIRGTFLMAISNKYHALVLNTSNKSEIAIGYCTLYGDMVGGFAVIKDVIKTLVYRLCIYRNTLSPIIPEKILTRIPSAELRFNQTDQDLLPPYDILDNIIHMYVEEHSSIDTIEAAGYSKNDIKNVIKLIKINEYKRRQAPIGIRVTNYAFGKDWRYPITSQFQEL